MHIIETQLADIMFKSYMWVPSMFYLRFSMIYNSIFKLINVNP